ncbi:MAG TPA: DNA-J related domain-containing protein, partial [Candidatus Ozemobacteraceae bacterium]|nr:DNA-J related domain-containing protein [Candidatus Ozemobacteraceae bacterium]
MKNGKEKRVNRDSMLTMLDELLRERTEWREEEILERLRERGYPVFAGWNSADPLKLFRAHFTLFHLLYLLQDRLRRSGDADLEIHCLRIARVRPFAHDG